MITRLLLLAPPIVLQHWGKDSGHRHESWFELFVDLLYVAGARKVAHAIEACMGINQGWIVVYGFIFYSVLWWSWHVLETQLNRFAAYDVIHGQ